MYYLDTVMTLDLDTSSSHLLKYLKYAKKDRHIFKAYEGKRDHESYTAHLQLHFQCDADLGGNLANGHSQTSYLGYLCGDLICWGSTDHVNC
jgi:hypothetical protein